MTYLQFLLLFLVAPTALLFALHVPINLRASVTVIGLTALAATIYAIPWDHAIIAKGAWDHAAGDIIGSAWGVPLEDYAFFLLQAAFTGVLTVLVLRRRWWDS
jgi:lycopene cyclase domain-containing protein